jgi:signal transduction histidine kinase
MRDFAVSNTAQLWHEITVEHSPRCLMFEISIRPVLAGEPDYEQAETGWVVVIRDVTDAREIRRRAQQQEQLAAVGQLAAGIAHDFNNILASINMAVEMVQRSHDNLSDANRERLAMVLGQGQRAADLIKQIMDFSRRSLSEQKEVDLRQLFDEAKRILEHTLPETIAVTWVDDGAPGGFVSRADPTQLMQVMMNLAVNARDAMPRGGALQFALSAIQVVDGDQHMLSGISSGDYVCIQVSDTGHGIDRESLPHVFEPFFTTKSPSQGTGLGLAQVYGIVQQHGGFIDVDSVPGEGTSFKIYLPRMTNPESISISPEAEVVSDVTSGAGQIVLLVEDDTMLRTTMCEVLEALNYNVIAAVNGREALEILEIHHERIPLVLSDLIMPVMGGAELCREIMRRYEGIQIILMTGYSPEEEILDLKAAGMSHWLKKPVSIDLLAQSIEAVFAVA